MPRNLPVVAFTAGKGGCGKTTLAVNLAFVVSQSDARVLLIDFDLNNQGATGNFSDILGAWSEPYGTTQDLILGALDKPPVEIRKGLHFLPARRPSDPPWGQIEDHDVADVVERMRADILSYARREKFDCIVLDCFCGIDPLTTASIACSDEALIVNEADLITYTGTLNLLYHLKETTQVLGAAPNIRFVVNRLRPPHSVKSLSFLYRDNLAREVEAGIICHVPHNERVARTFGQYPLIAELLPRSLFTKKLQLLAYVLFKDEEPRLLTDTVRRWSRRKFKKLFYGSVDPAAVDSETLMLTLMRFPLAASIWLIVFFGLNRVFNTDRELIPFYLVMCIFGVLIIYPLGRALWSAARFNFTLAMFRFRIARHHKSASERLSDRCLAFRELAIGTAMAYFMLVSIAFALTLMVRYFPIEEVISQLKSGNDDDGIAIPYTVDSQARLVDLTNRTLDGKYGYQWDADRILTSNSARVSFNQRAALVSNTTFREVSFPTKVMKDVSLKAVMFERPVFKSLEDPNDGLRIEGARLENCVIDNPMFIRGEPFKKILFDGDSKLTSVTLRVAAGTEIDLVAPDLKLVRVINLGFHQKAGDELGATVTVHTTKAKQGHIIESPGITIDMKDDRSTRIITQKIESTKSIIRLLDERRGKVSANQSVLIERFNLIEFLIIRGTPNDLKTAKTLLAETKRLAEEYARQLTKTKKQIRSASPIKLEGVIILLYLLHGVRTQDPDVRPRADAWLAWLQKHPRNTAEFQENPDTKPAVDWNWSWNTWNKNIRRYVLEPMVLRRFKTIEASAEGVISSHEFKEQFEALLK